MQNVFVQITNWFGSTQDAPVIIQASVMSGLGSLLPQRLKQLAQTIKGSPANLGLDNSVFGKVKSISLSSYLEGTLSSIPPSPSPVPSPSPEWSDVEPSSSPYNSPAPSPDILDLPPCFDCDASSPDFTCRFPRATSPFFQAAACWLLDVFQTWCAATLMPRRTFWVFYLSGHQDLWNWVNQNTPFH